MNIQLITTRKAMKKIVISATASLLFISISAFAQSPAPSATTTSTESQSAAPSDAQIAAIVVATNTDEVNAGKLAATKAKSREVKQFARKMATDHTSLNKSVASLASKSKIRPEPSADSKKLKEEDKAELKKLKGLKGDEFDRAYIDSQISAHERVLDTLDKTLIPSAKNEELKNLLTKARQKISDHLELAKKVQASLK
jgi:putative membrane protein